MCPRRLGTQGAHGSQLCWLVQERVQGQARGGGTAHHSYAAHRLQGQEAQAVPRCWVTPRVAWHVIGLVAREGVSKAWMGLPSVNGEQSWVLWGEEGMHPSRGGRRKAPWTQ